MSDFQSAEKNQQKIGVTLTRYTPFLLKSQGDFDKDIIAKFVNKGWNINLRPYHSNQMEKLDLSNGNFPILIDDSPPKNHVIFVEPNANEEPIRLNYLATILFNLIYASKMLGRSSEIDLDLLSGLLGALPSVFTETAKEQVDHNLLKGLLTGIDSFVREISPELFDVFRDKYTFIKLDDINQFPLINFDIKVSQAVYLYDSYVGFLVDQINIDGLDSIDQEFIYGLDFIFQIISYYLKFKRNNADMLEQQIRGKLAPIQFAGLSFIENSYDVVAFGDNVKIQDINEYELIDFPIVQVYGTKLKSDLILYKIKSQNTLINQADFRSIWNPHYQAYGIHPGKKLSLVDTISFIFLQIYHEKTQLEVNLDIYKESWNKWQKELTEALKWKSLQILFGGKMKKLSQLSLVENRLEFFFKQRYANLNFDVRMEDISKSINFHLLFIPRREFKLLNPDNLAPLHPFNIDIPINDLNSVGTFLEFIDNYQFIKNIANELQINIYYQAILDLHESFEKMLDTLQDLTQTKQQRLITITLVTFSVIQFVASFINISGMI